MIKAPAEVAAAFDAEHGESIIDGNTVYFEDGAYRDLNPEGLLADPSEDQRIRHRAIVAFWKLMLNQATEKFQSRKSYYLSYAKTGMNETKGIGVPAPASAAEAKMELTELKAQVTRCQEKLDAAEAEANAQKSDRELEREKLNAANREANAELFREVEKIEI